jgi:Lrp/AsnC family leucine-responsive transcriptional regulator
MEKAFQLDNIDKTILHILQSNARTTNAELAEQINLSPTPCLRRVKRLEENGYIHGYSAELNHEKLGIAITAVVLVQLDANTAENGKAFEQDIKDLPQVLECLVLTGKYDYLLRVVERSLKEYEYFIKHKLANVAHIDRIDTTIVLNEISLDKRLSELFR